MRTCRAIAGAIRLRSRSAQPGAAISRYILSAAGGHGRQRFRIVPSPARQGGDRDDESISQPMSLYRHARTFGTRRVRGRHRPVRSARARPAQSRTARLGRVDHGAAAQCAVHKSALPSLHPQHRARAEADAAVRLPALEYVAAGPPERDGDPNHRPRVVVPVRVGRPLPAGDERRPRSIAEDIAHGRARKP